MRRLRKHKGKLIKKHIDDDIIFEMKSMKKVAIDIDCVLDLSS
jgi:hypothetical protein